MTPEELKNSILQLAIQGKLVEQRPEEGAAEELYQQIQQEKQRLIKEGSIREEKPLPEIKEDEKNFDIPEGWKWVRFSAVITLLSGADLSPDKYNSNYSGMPYITGASNIDNNKLTIKRWTNWPNNIAKRGDLLLTCKGTVGKTYILHEDEVHIARQIMSITPIIINVLYVKYFIEGQIQLLKSKAKSMIPGIERDDILRLCFPLPPLAEQKRIVTKIEELLPLIDQYENAWCQLEEIDKRFPDNLKKSLLQMAIQGKLVEQRPEEGTGEELYQQIQSDKQELINEGKIKKEKPLLEITEEDKPFDIPESWKWVRLNNMAEIIVDCPHSTPQYQEEKTGFYALGTKCINAKGEITNLFNVDKDTYKKRIERLEPQANDIVYSREGSIVCRAVIIPENKKICLGQRVMLIRCPQNVFHRYVQTYLMTDHTIRYLTQNYKGVGVKHINVADVCALPIPIPPLAEQKRIVSCLDELFPLCNCL